MINRITINRLLFYWASSFTLAYSSYYALWLIMPDNYVFGAFYRMFLYHYEFPIQYIAIPCFFYGILTTFFANKFENKKTHGQILLTILIIILTILISSPFGRMLWHFHHMKAGYFPKNWIFKMMNKGFT